MYIKSNRLNVAVIFNDRSLGDTSTKRSRRVVQDYVMYETLYQIKNSTGDHNPCKKY